MLGFNPLATTPLADILFNASTVVLGQTLSLTQNSITPDTSTRVEISGVSLTLTQTALELTTGVSLTLDSQTVTTIQNNLSIASGEVFVLLEQVALASTMHSVGLMLYTNIDITGQAIHTTLNSMRMWNKIDTTQSPGWTDIET